MERRTSVGGAAASGGMDYQNRVAAWVATHILAEKKATPPWELPTRTTLEGIRCETEQPVDDLLGETSENGLFFAQIKRTLQLSQSAESDLASVFDQFVRQFVFSRDRSPGIMPSDRDLDPVRDRLLLITSSSSSGPVRSHLNNVLHRVRNLLSTQSLDDAVKNNDECSALSIVRQHISNSWQNVTGTPPSDEEIHQLLSLVHIQVLDMDEEENGERAARDLLRNAILKNPDDAEKAWGLLVSLCASLSAKQSGADRSGLQNELLNKNLQINAIQSYQQDINRLRGYSETTFEVLAHLAKIQVGPTTIKIQRQSTEALIEAAEKNSILIVGEPGAGKSGALHDLVKALREKGRDYIFLAVDRLVAGSIGELRAEIGLDHELHQVLDNWPGCLPGFLIIDALDAARGDPAVKMIRELIRMIVTKSNRWHVVASIRKFDLRYGIEIQELFVGDPHIEFHDAEFENLRHLNIPGLSEDELKQIGEQSPELQALISGAPKELNELLLIPFNLRLMAELLGAGMAVQELTPIRTQLELMERYWSHRILRSDRQDDAREEVLRRAVEKMVETRSLRVDRSAVITPGSPHLNDLLSSQVLIEWQPSPEVRPNRYILSFSHHVLFDYSVARLLFRGTTATFVDRLEMDPQLALIVTPSIILHFRHLWTADSGREQFWDLVFRVINKEDRIPEIGKLIGPSVAAELAQVLPDLESLCIALDDPDSNIHTPAEGALRHLIGALLVMAPGEEILVGSDAGPWCPTLERVSRTLRTQVAYAAQSLLSTISGYAEDFTDEQRITAGHTARRLLEFAWSLTPRDKWLVVRALEGVCRTFESDPAASADLIWRCLAPEHLSQYGFEEMPWLAREVKYLISPDPELVQEIYRAAFEYQETSEDQTPLGSSRILPLTSNRRQDYEMALYELAKVFPKFLEGAPKNATLALIDVMKAYVAQRHPLSSEEGHIEKAFDFNGQEVYIRIDQSVIWDGVDTYRNDDAMKMLDAFQQYLEDLAIGSEAEANDKLHDLVQLLISKNRLAILWRRMLFVGALFPNTMGKEIVPLAWAIPILTGIDTTTPEGEFLKAIFSTLERDKRERIELAILGIPEIYQQERRKRGERTRKRLIGCLTESELVTEDARRLLGQLKAGNDIPSNEPPLRFESGFSPYGEEEYLRDQGVPVDAEANRHIRDLEQPVKEFESKHLNTTPTLDEVHTVFPALRKLYEALSRADADNVHPKQRDYAWGYLYAACARIANNDGLSCEVPEGLFAKEILLEGSRSEDPIYEPEYDAQFDESPSWGSLMPRIESAEGLIVLARNQTFTEPDVIDAIGRLSNDPVPAVRFQIAKRLNAIYQTAPDFMWGVIERICQAEQSWGVIQGLLSGPVRMLARFHPERIAGLTRTIFDRVREGPGTKEVRKLCIGHFFNFYIWLDQKQSGEIILDITQTPSIYPDEVTHLLSNLRILLTHGPTEPPDPAQDAVRRRALDLLLLILRSARRDLSKIESSNRQSPFKNWSTDDQDITKSLMHIIDQVGIEVYFASGAYDNKRQDQPKKEQSLTPEQVRFYREVCPILDELSDTGLPSVAHNLIKTLEFFIPHDPRGVFLRIGHIVQSGQREGYQYESLAADLIVKLVERYLAEYRELLRDAECQQTLIEILNIFVKPGWPNARRLTYGLKEIFR